MNPNEFLKTLETLKKSIEEADLACINAREVLRESKSKINLEANKLTMELDMMMETMNHKKVA